MKRKATEQGGSKKKIQKKSGKKKSSIKSVQKKTGGRKFKGGKKTV